MNMLRMTFLLDRQKAAHSPLAALTVAFPLNACAHATYRRAAFPLNAYARAAFPLASVLFVTLAFFSADSIAADSETRNLLNQAKQQRLGLHPEAALRIVNQILASEPRDADALFERGEVFMELGRFDLAKKDADQCIQINPHKASYYRRRAKILDMSGHPQEAITDYDIAIKLDPKDTGCYRNRATAYKRTKNFAAAGKAYSEALEKCGTCSERARLMLEKGNMFLLANDITTASKSFEELVNKFPDVSGGHYGLARIFDRQGKADLAAKERAIARKLDLNLDPLLDK